MADRDAEFYRLADRFLDYQFRTDPLGATAAGVHDYDHLWPDVSPEALADQLRNLRAFLAEVESFGEEGLSPAAQVDRAGLRAGLQAAVWQFEEVRPWQRDPGLYLRMVLYGIHLLLIREFAPLEERLVSIGRRLAGAPALLEQGAANLTEPVAVWREVAEETLRGALPFLEQVVPAAARKVPSVKDQLLRHLGPAVDALRSYGNLLGRLAEKARPEFACGRPLFDRLLREVHFLPYDADSLLAKGEELFTATMAQIEEVARAIDPGRPWHEVVDGLRSRVPAPGQVLDLYRREVARARSFLEETGLVPLPPREELVVEETPSFVRPLIPFAAYMPPAPLEEQQVGRFWVTAPDPSLPPEVQQQVLQGHNLAKLPVTAVHEGYPGHHLQLTWAHSAPTRIRKLADSNLLAEGWAFYCEELMEEEGYLKGDELKLGRLADQLWRAARIILDASLHTRGMSVDEAISFLVERVRMEPHNARAEVRRYTASPTQPMSYLIGKLEIMQLAADYRAARGPAFDRSQFHRELLACGTIPPALARRLLIAPDAPPPQGS